MAGERLRGSETFITILVDGVAEEKIDSITSSSFGPEIEITKDQFLGEQGPRYDMFFDGVQFSIEGQLTGPAFLRFQEKIIAKARRTVGAAVRIDVTSTVLFPGGEVETVIFTDCVFGASPITVGGRTEHVTWTLEGNCSDYRLA